MTADRCDIFDIESLRAVHILTSQKAKCITQFAELGPHLPHVVPTPVRGVRIFKTGYVLCEKCYRAGTVWQVKNKINVHSKNEC